MQTVLSILRLVTLLVVLAGASQLLMGSAFAQRNRPAAEEPPPAPRYWAASYGITILGIVLGLVIVLRPGTRGGEDEGK